MVVVVVVGWFDGWLVGWCFAAVAWLAYPVIVHR